MGAWYFDSQSGAFYCSLPTEIEFPKGEKEMASCLLCFKGLKV